MRRGAAASFALVALTALTACTLLVDSGDLAGEGANDAGPSDVGASEGGSDAGGGGPSDSAADGIGTDGTSSTTTPLFDPGSSWPVWTSAASASPTTPDFKTSGACTDLVILANSGISAGSTASATISTTTGMTFTEVIKDSGNNADTIYIWRATSSCAMRSGTVTVAWTLTGGSIFWSNVVVFAFAHSKGIGAVTNTHNAGNTSINTVSITPAASGSWVFASLSGNNGNGASAPGTSGAFVQQWSGEGAVQSHGAASTPSATTVGVPVTFSLTTADNIWANAAAEVLSQ